MKSITLAAVAAMSCLAVAGCGTTQPNTVSSGNAPGQAPSGITSSNGGGMRQTGAIPSVSIGGGQATTTSVPNSKGAAY